MINKIAVLIWEKFKKFNEHSPNLLSKKRKEEMISSLNPGIESKRLINDFYVSKIEKIMILIMLSIVFLILIIVSRKMNRLIDDENHISRNNYGENSFETVLEAEYDDESFEIELTVEEREYKEEEIVSLYEECKTKLEAILLNNNSSFQHIETDLNPVSSIEDFPFYIHWESSNYNVLHEDGTLLWDNIKSEKESCILTAYFTYKNYKFEQIYEFTIYPPVLTEKEKKKNEIIASVQQMQEKTQYDSYLILPSSIGSKSISWKESEDYMPVMMATLLILASLGIWLGYDNDLARKYRKRNQLLNQEYAEFVSKLQLLIGSGMTLRNAFERMEADYIEFRKEGGKMKYAYEELRLCLKRMHEGTGEEECLNYFGLRCSIVPYKKLVSLLIQNSKKGSSGLIIALSNETKIAFEERKQIARRMGEEAQTKMLFPMILMLIVVMIIIIVPAYVSFGL